MPFLFLTAGIIVSRAPVISIWSPVLYLGSYTLAGLEIFTKFLGNLKSRKLFDENFLLVVATGGALFLGEFAEAAAVMSIYRLGEFLETIASERSRRFIGNLLSDKTERVHIQQENRWVDVLPQEVRVGDVFRVSPGERILLDSIVLDGASHIDTSSLTGESLPLFREKGDEVWSGSVNLEGHLVLRAIRDYEHSKMYIIAQLLNRALQKKASTERFITRFARYYTPLVMVLAGSLVVVPLLAGTFDPSFLYRALTVLMISCPCALLISIPLGFLVGLGKAAREGILIKGSIHLETLARLTGIFFDKTGTVTQGRFRVKEVRPRDGHSRESLIELASTVASYSLHPLAQAIQLTWGERQSPHFDHYQEIPGAGIIARIAGQEILLGNARLLKTKGIHVEIEEGQPNATVHLAQNGRYMGYMVLEDTVKEDAVEVVTTLQRDGIRVYLLSGDNNESVQKVARAIGIETFFAELLPEEKVKILEHFLLLKKPEEKIAFVGDGMNDAPVLARADLGIAMGKKGIDAAIETADIVLMTDELTKIPRAIEIARKTRRIIWQNIGLSIGMKVLFLVFALLGIASLWEAVFADVGVMSLAVLNSLRLMR